MTRWTDCVFASILCALLYAATAAAAEEGEPTKPEPKGAEEAKPPAPDPEKKEEGQTEPAPKKEDVGVVETNVGTIVFKFFPADAPNTVANFKKLARKGFYDGLIFHRVIKGFMIQGGCPEGTGKGGPNYTIKAEFNKRRHEAGTVAMARSGAPDSAGSQFYICLARQPHLDDDYTVFGQVLEGMAVVNKIGEAGTHKDANRKDRPKEDYVTERVRIEKR